MRTRTWFGSAVVHAALTSVLGLLWVAQAPAEDGSVVIAPPRRPWSVICFDPPRDLIACKKILDVTKTDDPILMRGEDDGPDDDELDATRGDAADTFVTGPGARLTRGTERRIQSSGGGRYAARTG